MGQFALIASLAGTAIQAVGAEREGEAASDAARFNARQSRLQASEEAYRVGTLARRARAVNVTRIAKSGVRSYGSPLTVLARNALDTELYQQNIIRAGRSAASLYRKQGNAAQEAAKYKIASSVLSGAGNALRGAKFPSLFSGQSQSYWAGGDTPDYGNIA